MKKLSLPSLYAAASFLALTALGGCDTFTAKKPEPELTPQQFMQSVYKEPGVKQLGNGLAYKVLKEGPKNGQQPHKGSQMMIIYEGRLPDGAIFDSSEDHTGAAYMEMPLDGVIEGWMQGLPHMHVGDTWMLYVPPELAYGKRSLGVIPPNSPLVFKISLLGVEDVE